MSVEEEILAELDAEDNVEDQHAEVAEEAEEKFDREDPVTHQLRKDFKELSGKFEQEQLQGVLNRFDEVADEVEKKLFKNVRPRLKDVGRAREAIDEIKELAATIKQQQEEIIEQTKVQASEEAARAWGTGPIGSSPPPATDEEKVLMERIAKGDMNALTESLYPPGSLPWEKH